MAVEGNAWEAWFQRSCRLIMASLGLLVGLVTSLAVLGGREGLWVGPALSFVALVLWLATVGPGGREPPSSGSRRGRSVRRKSGRSQNDGGSVSPSSWVRHGRRTLAARN
jgi:hypothetical protein